MAEVHLQDGETLESALRRFKRKVQQEDIIKEIKRHSFYLKPGEKKVLEMVAAGQPLPLTPPAKERLRTTITLIGRERAMGSE